MGTMVRYVLLFAVLGFAACGNEAPDVSLEAAPVVAPRIGQEPTPRTGPATCLSALSTTDPTAALPAKLSSTGCFTDLATLSPANHLAWYGVQSELYADGAGKDRFLSLPLGSAVTEGTGVGYGFPAGASLIKVFALPGPGEIIETVEVRFLFRGKDWWRLFTYRWDRSTGDGLLLDERLHTNLEVEIDGKVLTQKYVFPSESDCRQCHRAETGLMSLGFRAEQLNGSWEYPGGNANQIEKLIQAGYLAASLPTVAGSWPDPADLEVSTESRMRSYFASNCSHCHQPNGFSSPSLNLDLRYEKTLAETNLCDETLALAPRGSRRVVPGKPNDSWLLNRLTRTDDNRMSPWRFSPDPLIVELVTEWIAAMDACP